MSRYYIIVDSRELGFEIVQGAETTELRSLDSDQVSSAHVDLAAVHANISTGEGLYSLIVEGKSYQMSITRTDTGHEVLISGNRVELKVLTEREWRLEKIAPKHATMAGPYTVKAPMPGLVKAVLVSTGDAVSQGTRLLVLEAMKMENEITAIKSGIVAEILVQAGTVVEGGQPLMTIE